MNLLSEKLKEETSGLHRSIENVPIFRKLMSKDLLIEDYSMLITSWYNFVAPIEKQLQISPQLDVVIADVSERYKAHLIESDLKNLSVPIESIFSKHIPDCTTLEEAIGILYVLEGSSLGSQIISRHLQKHDFINTEILSFYFGYKDKTGSYWTNFKSGIDKWGSQNEQSHDAVIESAKSCFTKLALHMQEYCITKSITN